MCIIEPVRSFAILAMLAGCATAPDGVAPRPIANAPVTTVVTAPPVPAPETSRDFTRTETLSAPPDAADTDMADAQACANALSTCPRAAAANPPTPAQIATILGAPVYDPYIVGQPQAFVCSDTYAAEKRLRNRPNLQLMWEHYINQTPKGVWAEVGGMVEVNGCLDPHDGGWTNACTVRLSHMLNNAGLTIPRIPGQTVTGGSGDNYLFRLHDAERFLRDRFGKPDLFVDGETAWFAQLPDRPGLVIMNFKSGDATGHATIWNGAGTVDNMTVGGDRVLFWDLPCFVPPDRDRSLM